MAKRITSNEHKIDYWLMLIVVALFLYGMLMVFSSSRYASLGDNRGVFYYGGRQLMFGGIGLLGLYICARIEYHFWTKISIWLVLISIVAVLVVAIMGKAVNGSSRWFNNGSGQPSEVLKLTLIIYLAHWLSTRKESINNLSMGLVPFAILVGFAAGSVVLQDDLSTSILIALTSFVMFLVAGGEIKQLGLSSLVGGGIIALLILAKPYRLERILAFLKDPFSSSGGDTHQIQQVLDALMNGRFFGVGLGQGTHSGGFIPAVQTDAVFAIVGEELGFLGALALIGMFAFLVYRGLKIALNAPDTFGALLATGITVSVAMQVLINTAVNTALIPFTGIPLPFVSSGGSSMVMTLTGMGILLAVSRRTLSSESNASPMDPLYEADDFGRRNRGARVSRARRRSNA